MLAKYLDEQIYDMFWLSVLNNHSKLNKAVELSKDEAVSVYAYTNVHPPYYKMINESLRNGESDHFLIQLLDNAIERLPIFKQTIVYRWSAPPIEQIQLLFNGGTITELGFVSTLKEPNELDMSEPDCILSSIEHRTGRDISLYSDDFSAKIQEVLLPRNSTFKVSGLPNETYDLVLVQE